MSGIQPMNAAARSLATSPATHICIEALQVSKAAPRERTAPFDSPFLPFSLFRHPRLARLIHRQLEIDVVAY